MERGQEERRFWAMNLTSFLSCWAGEAGSLALSLLELTRQNCCFEYLTCIYCFHCKISWQQCFTIFHIFVDRLLDAYVWKINPW